jgi:uncharacterized protein
MNVTGYGGTVAPAAARDRHLLVRDNPEARRYEIYIDRHLAGYLRYHISNGEIWLIETTISRQHCIDNLVPYLASLALDTARQNRLDVRPLSPAMRRFMAIQSGPAAAAAGSQAASPSVEQEQTVPDDGLLRESP